MPDRTNQPLNTLPGGPLRRGDQAVLATLALFGVASILGWWATRGGGRGDLVEADRADRQEIIFRVDANRAAWPELAQLPGIGETLARRIVEQRRRAGPFRDLADIPRRVHGIGPKKFQKMRP